jgi:hypothetical protein
LTIVSSTSTTRRPRLTSLAIPARTPTRRFPIITGSLTPDLTFFGFDLEREEVQSGPGSEGWYFVLEERLSEPRFGIDEEPAPATSADAGLGPGQIRTWRDLAWTHFAVPAGNYIDRATPQVSATESPEVWGSSSAAIASILLQAPVRVAVHADQMLPRPAQTP